MTAADQSTLLPAIDQPKSSVSVYCGGAYHAQYLSKTVLPQTGGQGNVIIYSVAVSLAVAGGVILLVLRRKKKSTDKSA